MTLTTSKLKADLRYMLTLFNNNNNVNESIIECLRQNNCNHIIDLCCGSMLPRDLDTLEFIVKTKDPQMNASDSKSKDTFTTKREKLDDSYKAQLRIIKGYVSHQHDLANPIGTNNFHLITQEDLDTYRKSKAFKSYLRANYPPPQDITTPTTTITCTKTQLQAHLKHMLTLFYNEDDVNDLIYDCLRQNNCRNIVDLTTMLHYEIDSLKFNTATTDDLCNVWCDFYSNSTQNCIQIPS